MTNEAYGIHWFRRDLRVAGNPALQWNWSEHKGKTLGVFFFDHRFLSRKDFSSLRFQFFLETLKALKGELRELGGDLLVFNEGPEASFKKLFQTFTKQNIAYPKSISWNRDYEPFARERDDKIEALLQAHSIPCHHERDHLIIEPQELHKPDSQDGYRVYTPFSRRWLDLFRSPNIQSRIHQQKKGVQYLNKRLRGETSAIFKLTWEKLFNGPVKLDDSLDAFIEENRSKVSIPIPAAGSLEAYKRLKAFKKKCDQYRSDRDFPRLSATSQLSPYLKNGSINTSQIIAYLGLDYYSKGDPSGKAVFLSELIWREFYYHILYRYPEVEKQSFNPKYLKLAWDNNVKHFKAWKEGLTGFPIVDAGMRQLNTTGNMHNRVRMIVASFLVKDLLIDWRKGEQYFMEKLLDGDLAANNGGWQWAASTGCDAQPYFRIFNPWSQSKKFDLDGEYIKQYIPELKDLDARLLHQPILNHASYPAPLVDHAEQRLKAIALFKNSS